MKKQAIAVKSNVTSGSSATGAKLSPPRMFPVLPGVDLRDIERAIS